MNYKSVLGVLGKVMLIEAVLMLVPLFVGLIYGESNFCAFLIPIGALLITGLPLSFLKSKDKGIYAKEGFVIVALCWIILSLAGALPFVISREIPYFIDAFFETVSGFTTTGSSVLPDVEVLSRGIMFWRIFTHWTGGMGILVFVLAFLPLSNSGEMHIFRSESPGIEASKLVGKMRHTARILYAIYLVMTLTETVMLLCGGMPLYDAVLTAFSTAGTGGFGIHNGSIAYYNSTYIEMVIAVFMLLFSINFNVFYLILVGKFTKAIACEEMRVYIIIVVLATLIIALNILNSVSDFGQAVRYSFFQVTSISSTTGFASTDFNTWPALSKGVLIFLMLTGGCAGSTCGGIKISRLILLGKSSIKDIRKMANPRAVLTVKLEGGVVSRETENNVKVFFFLYITIIALVTLIICADPCVKGDFITGFTTATTCIGNVGPAFSNLGILLAEPMGSFAGFSWISKLVLSFTMLAGRLEIFPLLILFSPRTWKK